MRKLPVFWCNAPDEDESDPYIAFRLREEWVSVDDDQLVLPVSLLERNGKTFESGEPGILKQYGGEGLLNEMLLSDQDFEAGSEWIIGQTEARGRYVQPTGTDD